MSTEDVNIMPVAPCLECGAQTSHKVVFTGLLEGDIFMCEPCYEMAMVDIEGHRRQFNELIEAGVPRDQANALMIARIDGQEGS